MRYSHSKVTIAKYIDRSENLSKLERTYDVNDAFDLIDRIAYAEINIFGDTERYWEPILSGKLQFCFFIRNIFNR